jgi:pyruvate dehydrogenase E2 component (dihydrolipoamide acetyltransferase)
MADVIRMPKLGFDMAEGTLIRWAVGEGEAVEKGQLLAEIETDKATVEVESQFSGTVRQHLVTEGANVPVSKAIAVVGDANEKINLDELIGDEEEDEPEVVEAAPEPKKVESPIPSRKAAPSSSATPESAPASGNGQYPGGTRATPLARRVAQQRSIDLRLLQGSGPGGRIVKRDVENFVPGSVSAGAAAGRGASALPTLQMPDLSSVRADEQIPLSRLRGAIGRRMTMSRQEVPHFYVTSEYDLAPLLDVRRQANAALQSSGEKLSVNDFVIKASALALRQFPNLNAALDGDVVVHKGQVNIGVAVAVENGLLVVVAKDADRESIRVISSEVKEMAGRARSGNVHSDDIEGSTFSISNLGMYNVKHFVAIINPPEAAILALGASQEVPVVENGEIVVGQRMQATLSVDHRVSDGAEGAQFMQALGSFLENPAALLL